MKQTYHVPELKKICFNYKDQIVADSPGEIENIGPRDTCIIHTGPTHSVKAGC